jgi:nucleotide-binding universal stress UspA family protein
MKNVLIAVDDSKGSLKTIKAFLELYSCSRPEKITLLFVEKMMASAIMDEMLGESEMNTLKEELAGTEYQDRLDKRAAGVLAHYGGVLKENGIESFSATVKEGHPADEIIKTAKEEGADLIIVGFRGSRMHNFLMGSVSREVAISSDVPVLIAK